MREKVSRYPGGKRGKRDHQKERKAVGTKAATKERPSTREEGSRPGYAETREAEAPTGEGAPTGAGAPEEREARCQRERRTAQNSVQVQASLQQQTSHSPLFSLPWVRSEV